MPSQLRFPSTFPALNPPYLMALALKHTTLRQMLFDDVGNAVCCCLNILLQFGEGCYHDDTIAFESNIVPG